MNVLSRLCEEAEARIEALDGSAWATTSLAAPTWRHSRQHLDAVGSSLEQHLLFTVTVEGAPVTGTVGRSAIQVAADLKVVFLFKAGAGEKITRERLAMDAAAQVMGALLGYPLSNVANVEVLQAFAPGAQRGDFLPVELRFAALVDIPYTIRS